MFVLYLASQSPRRRQLLENAHISFNLLPLDISEKPATNLTPEEQIRDIAVRKAREAVNRLSQSGKSEQFAVLSADTEVVLDENLLGKPVDVDHARQMLESLSGRSHSVKTGVVLWGSWQKEPITHVETTNIFFKKLSAQEISDYIASGDPFDKAGAYGIQSGAGKFVDRIEGSFSNVVGLPMEVVPKLLEELKKSFPK